MAFRDEVHEGSGLVANVEVAVPFTPDADHSTIVPSEPVTAFSLHKHRGRTPSLPEIRLVGTGEYRGNAAGVVSELIAVEAVPGAIVTFHCPFLGSFANGADTIAVQADPQGLARVAFRCGRDAGRYPIHAVSPSCRGMATVEVEADVDLATSRKLAASLPRKHRPQTEPPD